MKRFYILAAILLTMLLTGCSGEQPVSEVKEEPAMPTLSTVSGTTLEQIHEVENFKFITSYNTGNYDMERWKITDSKVIRMNAHVKDVPEGTIVLVEHVHIDMSLLSEEEQLNGLSQASMDDSYHGTSQDGFLISEDYSYQNIFAIEGFSKDLIDGLGFVVYGNKMQVVYDLLIKYPGEDFYHIVSILDEFQIPVVYTE